MKTSLKQIKTQTPKVDGIYQRHALQILEPILTVEGEIIPAGTIGTVVSSGRTDGRMSCRLSLWGSGRQMSVYTD